MISISKSLVGIIVFSSPCHGWTSASLAAAFFCTLLILVSVVVLWFALPAVGFALLAAVGLALLAAVGLALLLAAGLGFLPAVGFALLGSFQHRSSSLSSSRCPRTLVALLRYCRHKLVGCGSVSRILTLALWLWLRLCLFFRVSLW